MKIKKHINPYQKSVSIDVSGTINVDLTEQNIQRWLEICDNPETLRRISRYASHLAYAIEHPEDYDDFRSRA